MMVIWQGVTNCLTIRFFRNIFAKNVQTIHVLSFQKLPGCFQQTETEEGECSGMSRMQLFGTYKKIIKVIEIIEGVNNETI